MLVFKISVESSSESTSRETTPESEGSDEEDENEDDLDEEVRNPFWSILIHYDPFWSIMIHFHSFSNQKYHFYPQTLAQQDDESNLPDMDIVPAKPIIHRETSDLAEEYSKFFIEYSNPEVCTYW